ncbi:Pectate lyase catalytic [Macrophomina phaseolina MS6]|uniref:pectate lyase n=1 Tax=Macrophomina phaseolina (strain MS6) TaxID=1126212 RepID=K2R7V1_MACPH|nr:Pectate lyase catalytic [Macrophomina phaseolina MS6]
MFHSNGEGPWDLDEYYTDEQYEINLTQTAAVVPDLVAQLCPHELPFDSPKYIVWIDNLLTSARLMTTLRNENIGAAGTVRMGKTQREKNEEKAASKKKQATKEDNRGLHQRLRDLRSKNEGQIEWGTQYCCLSQDEQSMQFGWQDARIVLFMSTVHDGKQWVIRRRRRPTKTSTNSKITQKPFGDNVEQDMEIPRWADEYNHNKNAVDRFDQFKAERQINRLCYRTWKPLWNFLFQSSIISAYLLTCRGLDDDEKPPFASLNAFRQRLWEQLFERSERVDGRRGRAEPRYREIPREEHQYERLKVQGNCSESYEGIPLPPPGGFRPGCSCRRHFRLRARSPCELPYSCLQGHRQVQRCQVHLRHFRWWPEDPTAVVSSASVRLRAVTKKPSSSLRTVLASRAPSLAPSRSRASTARGSCTIENVWWAGVCEDALSLKGNGNAKIIGGGATGAEDKGHPAPVLDPSLLTASLLPISASSTALAETARSRARELSPSRMSRHHPASCSLVSTPTTATLLPSPAPALPPSRRSAPSSWATTAARSPVWFSISILSILSIDPYQSISSPSWN